MRIAVLSDTRVPTRREGGHGLGRMAWDIAEGLGRRGHEVLLYAGIESVAVTTAPFGMIINRDEISRAEMWMTEDHSITQQAVIDLSHQHDLSRLHPDLPVVNWIVDLECPYAPPNAVVGNWWQQKAFPSARIVPLGIDVNRLAYFERTPRHDGMAEYLAYCAKIHPLKGFDLAMQVHMRQPIPVRFVGERFVDAPLPDWRPELCGDDFEYFISHATALLSPCRKDAGGRINLEAAAMGTPVLCLDGTGTQAHVEHGVSGFVCKDVDEMLDAVQDVGLLDAAKMRDWVRETHGIGKMIDGVESALKAVESGERW